MTSRLRQLLHRLRSFFREAEQNRDLDAECPLISNSPSKKMFSAGFPPRKRAAIVALRYE